MDFRRIGGVSIAIAGVLLVCAVVKASSTTLASEEDQFPEATEVSPDELTQCKASDRTVAAFFLHADSEKSNHMEMVADMAAVEASTWDADASPIIAKLFVNKYPEALAEYGIRELPTLFVFPAGLGARIPIKIPYSPVLPEDHYLSRIAHINALSGDPNGDTRDILEAFAQMMHSADREASETGDKSSMRRLCNQTETKLAEQEPSGSDQDKPCVYRKPFASDEVA